MSSRILIERIKNSDEGCIGNLYLIPYGKRKKFFCNTLEDPVRPQKIKGDTAIPEGSYPIAITYSPKFKRYMPEVLNVPNFEGIRIHSGNTKKDTSGCILVGVLVKGKFLVIRSRETFNKLFKWICEELVINNNNVTLEIVNVFQKKENKS